MTKFVLEEANRRASKHYDLPVVDLKCGIITI